MAATRVTTMLDVVLPVLPDLPDEWSEGNTIFGERFRQCWRPGAFGDKADIKGVTTYRVLRETWDESKAVPERVILEAEVCD